MSSTKENKTRLDIDVSKLLEGCPDREAPEEGQMLQRPKRWDYRNKDVNNYILYASFSANPAHVKYQMGRICTRGRLA